MKPSPHPERPPMDAKRYAQLSVHLMRIHRDAVDFYESMKLEAGRCPSSESDCKLVAGLEADAAKLQEARQRLIVNDYGYCCQCDRKISVDELRALPFKSKCADCDRWEATASRRRRANWMKTGHLPLFNKR